MTAISRTWKALVVTSCIVAISLLSVGCAQEVGDIDQTQAKRIPKEQFAGAWYYVRTVTDIPQNSGWTFKGETNFDNDGKVIFDVQEKYLVAYPILESVQDLEVGHQEMNLRRYWDKSRRDEFMTLFVGQPLAMWPIESHFDVKRSYSTTTGEQSNVIGENTSDRPWWERDYVRVDWASETLKHGFFISATGLDTSLSYVQEYEQDVLNPDAPEFEDGYMSVITKYLGRANPRNCSVYMVSRGDCNDGVVSVRHSFRRADPADDVEVRVFTNREHMNKFGYFLKERYGYDDQFGYTDSAKVYMAQLWKLWIDAQDETPYLDEAGAVIACETNADCPGVTRCMAQESGVWFEDSVCTVLTPRPYMERGLNPIIYHLNPGYPGVTPPIPMVDEAGSPIFTPGGEVAYTGGQVVVNQDTGRVHPLVLEAYETADNWSKAFKETVSWLFFHEKLGTLNVAEANEGTRACESHEDCLEGNSNILAWAFADTTKKVSIACSGDGECPNAASCFNMNGGESTADGSGLCAEEVECAGGGACPLGAECKPDGLCYEADGGNVVEEKVLTNTQAYTFVAMSLSATEGEDGAEVPGGVGLIRLVDDILPTNDLTKEQLSAKGLIRFVNASAGTTATLRVVTSDPAVSSQDSQLLADDVFKDVGVYSDDFASTADNIGTMDGVYRDKRFPYKALDAEKLRRIEILVGGKVVASLTNAKIAGGKAYTYVFAGGDTLIAASGFNANNTGVRFVQAAKDAGPLDFGLDSLLLGRNVEFGQVGVYTPALVEGLNRAVVLNGGSQGDVTCYNDEGNGKCIGWGPLLNDETDEEVAEIYAALPEMFTLCEPIYTGDNCTDEQIGNLAEMNDCRYSTKNEDGSLSNPCKDNVDHADTLKKIGDIRYNHFYWIEEAAVSSPWGYGPSESDPETGRTFYAAAYVYGAPTMTIGRYAQDLMDLINGNLDENDVINGTYISDYMKSKTIKEESTEHIDEHSYALSLGSSPHGHSNDNPMMEMAKQDPMVQQLRAKLPAEFDVENKLNFVNQYLLDPSLRVKIIPDHNPLHSTGSRQARLDKIRGTALEDMLLSDEVIAAGSDGTFSPGMEISDDWRAELSVATVGGPEFMSALSKRNDLLAQHNVYMAEFSDGALVGLAHELGCQEGELDGGATEITDYITATDIIETEKEATGIERLPSDYCLSGEALRYIVMARMFGGVLEHEVGHTMGLRHNFSGGNDVFNYQDEWYDIRERESVICLDAGGCDYTRGEVCKQDCETDADCPAFAACEEFIGSMKACFDKRDKYNDLVGICMVRANVSVSDEACTFDAQGVSAPSLVTTLVDGECQTRTFCGEDIHCGVGESCKKGFCATSDGTYVQESAVVTSCEQDSDCGETAVCGFADIGDGPESDRVCVSVSLKIAPRATLSEKEIAEKRAEYQYSTVMDYGQKLNSDIHGLGKYDHAAIKFGYGDLVEVFKDGSHVEEFIEGAAIASNSPKGQVSIYMSTSFWGSSIVHPFFFLNHVIGPENVKSGNRSVMPYQQVVLDAEMQYDYLNRYANNNYLEVPYEFCSDEFRGNGGCYYFDVGADDLEIVENSMGMLRNYYLFDAFKRDRLSFGWGSAQYSYFARISDRWMRPMRNSGLYNGLYTLIFGGYGDFWRTFTKEPMSGLHWRGSAELAVSYLTELISSPAPGSYELNEETGDFVHVSFEAGMGTGDTTLNIPLGVGKFPSTNFEGEKGYYKWNHPLWVGSYWEKFAALRTLTDSDVSFLSDYVGEQLQIGVSSSIGFNTMYPTELNNLFGGIISGDSSRWWGTVVDDGTGNLKYKAPNIFAELGAEENGARVQPSIDTLEMKTLATLFAVTSLPAGFDPSVTDSLAVVLKGNHSEYDLGAGMDWVEFTDPFSGKTFLALKPNYDDTRIATAFTLVNRGNAMVEELLNPGLSDDDALELETELEELVYVLQMLREANEVYGIISL